MASLVRILARKNNLCGFYFARAMSGEGHIREAGGKFAEREMAEENRYFRRLQAEQLKALKEHHAEEIQQLEKEIKRLKGKVDSHKSKIKKLPDEY